VKLISSRSARCSESFQFKGLYTTSAYGDLEHVVLNGPRINLGFNLKRAWSWIWFEVQLLRYHRRVKSWDPDIVVVSSLSLLTFLYGIFLKWMLKRPLVIEVRDVYPETLVQVGGFNRWNPVVFILGWIERMGYRNADAIVSSLPNLESHVQSRLGYHRPVTYLPMGYESGTNPVERLSPEAVNAIDRISRLRDKTLFAYIGSLGKANAIDGVLRAFARISKDRSDIHLLVIGDGPLRSKFESQNRDSQNVHFLGWLPGSEINTVLEEVDVAVSPWLDRDIYRFGVSPNKWIDYMAAAKPILACYGGFKFLLNDENCGWFIPPEDENALVNAVHDISQLPAAERIQKGQRGRDYLKVNLNYQLLAAKLRKLLDDVVAKAKT